MRIPYIVGRWVRGRNHYGRQRLIEYLMSVDDSATWLVGTRRMGKTSLLRQLELMTDRPESQLVPVFWDLQGCQTSYDLSSELFFSLEDVVERFSNLGIDVDRLAGKDALDIMRRLGRALSPHGKRLFLLIDEAEVLMDIARDEPVWLARLRKVLQEGRQRTIITSTKYLANLNDANADWKTSPFFFGFNLANLWKLDDPSATCLVRQLQNETPVRVADQIVDDVIIHTNGHPYLIQYLCQRLFVSDAPGQGELRPITDEDLVPDHILSGFFQIDFQYLTPIERRLLLAVAELAVAKESELFAALADETPQRIRMFLFGLDRLGYLRQVFGQWAVGNEYLRRWIQDNFVQLSEQTEASIGDEVQERILRIGRENERNYLQDEIRRIEQELADLLAQRDEAGDEADEALLREIEQLRRRLVVLRSELESLTRTEDDDPDLNDYST